MSPAHLWIVWSALSASLAVYALLPQILPAPTEALPAPAVPLVGALLGAAVVIGLASVALRQLALVRPARSGKLDIDSPAGLQRWLQTSIVLWVLSESVGILGLLLWLLYRQPGLLYPFLSGAALLFVVHAPRAASLRDPRPRKLARPDLKIG